MINDDRGRSLRLTAPLAAGALVLTALAAPAAAVVEDEGVELTVLSTTDVHGHVYNWDYFANAPYSDPEDVLGLARAATVVNEVREAEGEDSVVLLDNGDAIQGTPLTYYYSMREPITETGAEHPMATAFNLMGYDAQVVGNHEYNYDLDILAAYEEDLNAPLLGANVIEVATGEPYHEPYTLIDRTIDGEEVTVGVVGLVTPGVRIWDRAYVEGILEFEDMVTSAQTWVPRVREAGADVVVVIAHTGEGNVPNEGYDPSLLHEDVINNIAYHVPGIDLLVAGHTHQDIPGKVYTNSEGGNVFLTQPNYWARSINEVTLNLVADGEGGWDVDWSEGNAPTAVAHYGVDGEDDPALLAALAEEHETTVEYVNTPVATSVTELPAVTSRYEDTPIIDFINHIQAETVREALAGTDYADIPVISQASPFSRTAVFPEGNVSVRDIAGLYIFDNTLGAVQLTGAQIKDYLEYSARYFNQVEPGAEFDPETGTNAVYPDRPEGVPDYNYDALSGLEYYIDIAQPVGERIVGLSHPDGTPVADDDLFILAVNNYRANGGGGFPHVAEAPVVYNELLEIRQLLIDWATEREVIDPDDFYEENWWLITEPLEEEPTPEPTPTEMPTTATPTPTPDDGGTPTPTVAPTTGGGGQLPATGAGADQALAATALLLLAGAGGVLAARRRVNA